MLEAKILDTDIGLEIKKCDNPKRRVAARGILRKGDKIALLNKVYKNEYKLPGGGVDEGEDAIQAFEREMMEETGCTIENIEYLGTIEEIKSHTSFHHKSYVYVADVKLDTHTLHLTEKETLEGAKLHWVSIDEAIDMISDCFDKLKPSPCDKGEGVYGTKFVIKRDLTILKYYKDNILGK